jgi:predicted DNA-binding transcriptional regulator YafY
MSGFCARVIFMRASRLLSIMMTLQAKGLTSAEALAEELEVSVRTIYRDIDELSASGVPVYAETGRNGGFALLDGWRTRLTGLTPPEAQALFLSGLPGPASELGLGDAMAAAELKLLAALPADWQIEAQRVSSRFHLDPKGWFQPTGTGENLRALADAVWSEKPVEIEYESWKGYVSRRIEPLGLVLKGGAWYVIGQVGDARRTYRIDKVQSLVVIDERFNRPDNFDLAAFWVETTEKFEKEIYVGFAELRATELGLSRLRDLNPVCRAAVDALKAKPEANGWTGITIPVEEVKYTSRILIGVGREIEVLGPPDLRASMAEITRDMAALYTD